MFADPIWIIENIIEVSMWPTKKVKKGNLFNPPCKVGQKLELKVEQQ